MHNSLDKSNQTKPPGTPRDGELTLIKVNYQFMCPDSADRVTVISSRDANSFFYALYQLVKQSHGGRSTTPVVVNYTVNVYYEN